MNGLVEFSVEDRRLAVPIEIVDKAIRMCALTPMYGTPEVIRGIVNLSGQIIAAVDLRIRLGMPSRPVRYTDRLLIVRTAKRALALIVDEVSSVIEVEDSQVVASDTILPKGGLVRGVTIKPDGLLFIYDLDLFLSLEEEHMLTAALQGLENVQ